MNIDLLLYTIFTIPVIIVGVQSEKLKENRIFLIWISISIFIVIAGIVINSNSNKEMRNLNYFGSQMLLIFLIIQKITRNIYLKLFRREPEFGKSPKHKIDLIYSSIIAIGTMMLPFLLEIYVFRKF